MEISRLREAWDWYRANAINRNFEAPFPVWDLQNQVHIVDSRRQLWTIAWATAAN